jgi:hypothetical protein
MRLFYWKKEEKRGSPCFVSCPRSHLWLGCPHRAQATIWEPKFMYFDGSVTWRLNISASLSTQTKAYAQYKPNRMCPTGKRAVWEVPLSKTKSY